MAKVIKRGQVWFYSPKAELPGSIQRGPRPVIIVSNDILNQTSSVVLGVPCTTQIKRNFATHTLFIMNKRVSVALTEQIMPVNVEDLTTLEYILEDYVMRQVDEALLAAIALNPKMRTAPFDTPHNDSENVNNCVDNVHNSPIGNQVSKFYQRYPQLDNSQRSRRRRWTEAEAKQLVVDFESVAGRRVLEAKYHLPYDTLRRYYYKFRDGGK